MRVPAATIHHASIPPKTSATRPPGRRPRHCDPGQGHRQRAAAGRSGDHSRGGAGHGAAPALQHVRCGRADTGTWMLLWLNACGGSVLWPGSTAAAQACLVRASSCRAAAAAHSTPPHPSLLHPPNWIGGNLVSIAAGRAVLLTQTSPAPPSIQPPNRRQPGVDGSGARGAAGH